MRCKEEGMSDSQPSASESLSPRPHRRPSRRTLLCAVAAALITVAALIATGVALLLVRDRSAPRVDENDNDAAARAALLRPSDGPSSSPSPPSSSPPSSGEPTRAPSPRPSAGPTTTATTAGPTDGPTGRGGPVTFYAVGDVPYSDAEACLLPYELDRLSPSDGRFLVHLGDIQDGRFKTCPESLYEGVAGIFESSPVPTFFVIGDNEWLDCGPGLPARRAFARWEEHLLTFYERDDLGWPALDVNLTHHPDHPELYSFLLDGVLFLGQGLPYPQPDNVPPEAEWRDYLTTNADCTRDRVDAHAGRMRAVVILAHSVVGPYLDELKDIALSYDHLPMLFLEDFHYFDDETFPDVPNLYRIALDDTVTPASITVDADAWRDAGGGEDDDAAVAGGSGGDVRDAFRYDRRCWCTDGHRPTAHTEWRPDGRCGGACDRAHDACAGENPCGTGGDAC